MVSIDVVREYLAKTNKVQKLDPMIAESYDNWSLFDRAISSCNMDVARYLKLFNLFYGIKY